MGRRTLFLTLVVLTSVILGCFGRSDGSVAQAENDVGLRDFSFSDANALSLSRSPTGQKPQSKLWFNDGSWWGSLYDRSTGEYHIYRYSRSAQTWRDTGTLIDGRDRSKADTLWDGTHLYVASAATNSSSASDSARLMRYSYDPASRSYSLDTGFPVTIADGGMEAVVLAKDTTGKLWATYTRGERVYINRSLNNDLVWGEPFVLPARGTAISPDDISAVIAHGSHIGVMWSNQHDNAFYFATHRDGEAVYDWESSVAIQSPNIADDHINLKATPDGRVYAAVKTSLDEAQDRNPAAPLVMLLARDRDGRWDSHVVSRVSDKQTRPIAQIDQQNRALYVFATAPCCKGGTIYYKRTNLGDISFPEGQGIPFIQSTTDTQINDATSTKQNIVAGMGLPILASDLSSGFYLHNAFEPDALYDNATP
jgi:hypothetical protein